MLFYHATALVIPARTREFSPFFTQPHLFSRLNLFSGLVVSRSELCSFLFAQPHSFLGSICISSGRGANSRSRCFREFFCCRTSPGSNSQQVTFRKIFFDCRINYSQVRTNHVAFLLLCQTRCRERVLSIAKLTSGKSLRTNHADAFRCVQNLRF